MTTVPSHLLFILEGGEGYGVMRVWDTLLRGLPARGHRVSVLLLRDNAALRARLETQGIDVLHLPVASPSPARHRGGAKGLGAGASGGGAAGSGPPPCAGHPRPRHRYHPAAKPAGHDAGGAERALVGHPRLLADAQFGQLGLSAGSQPADLPGAVPGRAADPGGQFAPYRWHVGAGALSPPRAASGHRYRHLLPRRRGRACNQGPRLAFPKRRPCWG